MADSEIVTFVTVQAPLIVCGISIILGAIGLAVAYYINRKYAEIKNEKRSDVTHDIQSLLKYTKMNPPATASTSKRGKNRKQRGNQQRFTHPWMVGNLKGHTAPVIDMSYSSNGKYLTSSAEDCIAPMEKLDLGGRAVVDDHSKSTTSGVGDRRERVARPSARSSSGDEAVTPQPISNCAQAVLSRRQRKNRTRTPRQVQIADVTLSAGNSSSSCSSSSGETSNSSPNGSPPGTRKNRVSRNTVCFDNGNSWSNGGGADNCHGPGIVHGPLHAGDPIVPILMRQYVLRYDELIAMGYPVPVNFCPGHAAVYKDPFAYKPPAHVGATAREFVPARGKTYSDIAASWTTKRIQHSERSGDSGHCSGSSLESSDVEPESSDCNSDKASDIAVRRNPSFSASSSSSASSLSGACSDLERTCIRCLRSFYVCPKTNDYVTKERCVYHWGKFYDSEWTCCRTDEKAVGCSFAKLHVWTGLIPGMNAPLQGYINTIPKMMVHHGHCHRIYALDCEMCFTKNGLELIKITIVGIDGRLVYDTLVKPSAEVIDYNTRFSGISAEDFPSSPKTLSDVQNDIMSFVDADTILIGHGLENDLRALKIMHFNCIDTGAVFPHYLGLPYRRSLKSLARTILRREIQNEHHNSIEDAQTTAELLMWRLRYDLS